MLTLTAATIKPTAWKTVGLEDQIDFQELSAFIKRKRSYIVSIKQIATALCYKLGTWKL